MSATESGALVHAPPMLRRKLPAASAEPSPVPPFPVGTMPNETVGVVVGFITKSGAVAPTLVTLPGPGGPGGPVAKSTIEIVVNLGSTLLYLPWSPFDEGASPVIRPAPITLFAVKVTSAHRLSPGMKTLADPR